MQAQRVDFHRASCDPLCHARLGTRGGLCRRKSGILWLPVKMTTVYAMTSYLGLWLDMPEGCLLATNHRIRTAMKSQSSLKEEAASGLMLFVSW